MLNTPIKSFSQALEFLKSRGAIVKDAWRTEDGLVWNVDGQVLIKQEVVWLAKQLQQTESEAEHV